MYEEILQNASKRLIIKDGMQVKDLLLSRKLNNVASLALLPFVALYCRETQEFLGESIIDEKTDEKITDLRNGIKIFSDQKYSISKTAALASDANQNKVFKDKLRFQFMKNWNIHYNLGIYFDNYGHVIGNTQLLNHYLQGTVDKDELKMLGMELGNTLQKELNIFLHSSSNIDEFSQIGCLFDCPAYQYIDTNTNRKKSIFLRQADKEVSLIILHLLSTLGFVEHVLRVIIPSGKEWVFRIRYIAAHYAWSGIWKLKRHHENQKYNPFDSDVVAVRLIEDGKNLFKAEFRNCMMHYGFLKNETAVINEKYFSLDIPFYGLAESCFDKSYTEVNSELTQYIEKMERYLSSWFYFDVKKMKNL